MRTKFTMMFVLLFICMINKINAQQEDGPTLEETVEWLDTYVDEYGHYAGVYGDVADGGLHCTLNDEREVILSYHIVSEKNGDYDKKNYQDRFNIKHIEKIMFLPNTINNEYKIHIIGIPKFNLGHKDWKQYDMFFLLFKDKSEALRVYKAFKHLYSFFPDYDTEFVDKVSLEDKF